MRGFQFSITVALLFAHTVVFAAADRLPLSVEDLGGFTVARGQVMYQRYCIFCHGENGDGDGQNAFSLSQRPPDFTQKSSRTDEETMRAVIEQGGGKYNLSPAMPSFGKTFSLKRVELLVDYIQSFVQNKQPTP